MSRPGPKGDDLGAQSRRDQIVAILGKAGVPLPTGQIARALGVERKVATSALAKLFEAGVIQRSKAGGPKARDGLKERTWRLPPAQAASSKRPA